MKQQLCNGLWLSLTVVMTISQPVEADTTQSRLVDKNTFLRQHNSSYDSSLLSLTPTIKPVGKTAASSLQKEVSMTEIVAQNNVPPTGDRNIIVPTVPTPATPGTAAPTAPAVRPPAQTPNYLNPSPNPLQFPTRPEEVRIQGTQPITLQQALELAQRNNRQLEVARLNLERSRASLREAQAALLPNASLNAGLSRSQSAQPNQGFPEQEVGASTAFNGTAQLSYNIYTSGERSSRIRAAEEQIRLNELQLEQTAEQLRLDVSNDYYNLQAADELVRINQSAVTNAQASLRDAQALEQAGVGTRFDVLRSEVQLANATQELTNALSQQQNSRRQLAARLSLAQSVSLAAAEPVQIAGLWNLPLEDSIVLAFRNRAELQQQLAQRNISEAQRRIALSQLGPRVGVSINYNVLDVFDDGSGLADGYSLGANVSLNLYDGGAARARARQEEANIAIAETNFADTRNQVRFEVEEAYNTLQSNLANIQTASVALEQAREALRLARLRFQAGVGTQTEVIDAENDLTNAEGNRVTAILDYNRALARLQRAISSGQPR
ncbi:TolC family protein [Chroogloeocystis siderophila]|uniref:Transporter n=1 Tax=Chroogloeocystis siderophila 5.2 s.c.1 TaxID=247279 RepID=A0A1U7HQF9_9CHRO|nr:TolC family protein [Chroogloeocystis siderophila]OKH25778.1 transporter [Chroogloeocystis siderophila 5.2 s.c.1]